MQQKCFDICCFGKNHYSEGDALLPRWSLSVIWILFMQLLLSFLFSQDGLVVVFWLFKFFSVVAFVQVCG